MFRIHRREAGQFRKDRVFLLGDAAHIHSPVGGQGMNAGIQDAFNLAWKLSLVLRNGNNPGLLDSYEAERKPVDETVIRQTDRATRLVSLHGSVTRFVRDHLMSLLTRLPIVQERLGEGLSGIAVNYRHSPIVEEHASGIHGPSAGDRAPDAAFITANGRVPGRLYDLYAEHRHVLLLLGNAETWRAPLPHFPDRDLAVRRVVTTESEGEQLIDSEGAIAARYSAEPTAYLIRPDGYVGFRCGENQFSAHFPRYLGKLFGSASSNRV